MRPTLALALALAACLPPSDWPDLPDPRTDAGDEAPPPDLGDADECAATDECLAACVDPCALECLQGCWLPSPDCLGTACVLELACEACP